MSGCTRCNGWGRIRLSTWGGSVQCYLCNGTCQAPPVKQGGRYPPLTTEEEQP